MKTQTILRISDLKDCIDVWQDGMYSEKEFYLALALRMKDVSTELKREIFNGTVERFFKELKENYAKTQKGR